jgi:hypothetical protein
MKPGPFLALLAGLNNGVVKSPPIGTIIRSEQTHRFSQA